MKLSDYLYKNVQITTDKEATLTGYVANYFRGADNDDGLDSIGSLKKQGDKNGIELSIDQIKEIVIQK